MKRGNIAMKLVFAIAASMMAAFAARGAGEARPFPRHTVYARGALKPSRPQAELDAAVLDFYRAWKAGCLRRTVHGGQCYVDCAVGEPGASRAARSVSEGHGYGMLALVLMAGADPEAHADFDAMFRYLRAHPAKASPALMGWQQFGKGGAMVEHTDEDRETAPDGDLDIACALLMAGQQWGNSGAVDYRREALAMIRAIRAVETRGDVLSLGSWVDSESPQRHGTRLSDFMPAHFKAFAAAEGGPFWTRMTAGGYRMLAELTSRYSPAAGLFPDFAVRRHGGAWQPAPPHFLESRDDGCFGYNACRVPWRLGMDFLLTGDERARALLAPLDAWAERITGGDPSVFNAGYRLDGTPLAEDDSAAFLGPLAVAAMVDPACQRWLDALWTNLLARPFRREGYYGGSLKLLAMIVISGNWWQP